MRHYERSGLLFALAGFAVLSVGDGVVKTMAGLWSPVGIAALRFTLAAVALGGVLWLREGASGFRLAQPRAQFGRGAALAVSSTIFFTSLFVLPLATATAIGFTGPLFIMIGAFWFLREPVHWERRLSPVVAPDD